ncbi:MAG: molybdenum cofactor biosynthesis protein MoaE [Caulobacteraceae bacterium]
MIALATEAFDPGAELNRFCRGRRETGAVASFLGLARGDGGQGLELEAYPGFTEGEIDRIAAEAAARFALHDVAVVHRVGRVAPGEAVVLVLTAAAHRREAFEGCDFLMDYLKSRAPLWKKEHAAAGPRWVEPTARDRVDVARWGAEPKEDSR